MRGARAAALLLVLPFAGCIFAVDHGGRGGLEKRIEKLEKRVKELEKGRPAPAEGDWIRLQKEVEENAPAR